MDKYSWQKIDFGKYYVWHTENQDGDEIKTLIAITDTAEKAHFLTTAVNHLNNIDRGVVFHDAL